MLLRWKSSAPLRVVPGATNDTTNIGTAFETSEGAGYVHRDSEIVCPCTDIGVGNHPRLGLPSPHLRKPERSIG